MQAVGMLIYMKRTSRLDISMVTYQAARFYINSNLSHERAVHRIGRYLKGTKIRELYSSQIIIKAWNVMWMHTF